MSEESKSFSQPTNENGVKLPYFHRKLSEEDQALLGDIAPKKIDSVESLDSLSNKPLSTSSAWNQGTTWEERDCTRWAKSTIERLFRDGYEMTAKNISIDVLSAEDINGNAQITHSRGKPRYLYELSFQLVISVTEISTSKTYSGVKIKVIDAINDQLDDMELEVVWAERPNSNVINEMKTCLKNDLRAYILRQFKNFESEFRNI
jgi:hypothetical protein